MKLLVFGSKNQLALSLKEISQFLNYDIILIGKSDAIFTDFYSISDIIEKYRPDCVVNTISLNNLRLAEQDKELATKINCYIAQNIASATKYKNLPLIHISSSMVFNGHAIEPYSEKVAADPVNMYGRTKLIGEDRVIEYNPNSVILRTSLVYSKYNDGFIKSFIEHANNNPKNILSFPEDNYISPTSSNDLARAILDIALNLKNMPNQKDLRGIFHISSKGVENLFSFADFIANYFGNFLNQTPKISSKKISDMKTTYEINRYNILDCSKLLQIHGVALGEWRKSVRLTIENLAIEEKYHVK